MTKKNITLCLLGLLVSATGPFPQLAPSEAAPTTQSFRARTSQSSLSSETTASDIKTEIEFGREIAAHILGRYKILRDEKLSHYVNLVGKAIAMNCNRPELNFRFAILQTSSVNAYAAPGGYIFITMGALDMMNNEAELAGALAHEIAHTTQRHIVKELGIKGAECSPQAGIAHLLGAMGDPTRVAFKQSVDKAMNILFSNGYRRQDEFEADRIGTLLLATTGYAPLALARYIARIGKEKNSGALKILRATHPAYDKRQAALISLANKYGLNNMKNPTLQKRFISYVRKVQ